MLPPTAASPVGTYMSAAEMICKQLRLALMQNTYAGRYLYYLGTSGSLWGHHFVFGDQMSEVTKGLLHM